MGATEVDDEIPMINLMMTALVNVVLVTAVLVTAVLLLNPEGTIQKAIFCPSPQETSGGNMTGNESTTGLRRSSSHLTPDLELVIKGSGPFAKTAVSNPSLVPEPRLNVSFPTRLRNSNNVLSELPRFPKLLKLYRDYTLCHSEITTFP